MTPNVALRSGRALTRLSLNQKGSRDLTGVLDLPLRGSPSPDAAGVLLQEHPTAQFRTAQRKEALILPLQLVRLEKSIYPWNFANIFLSCRGCEN
jgi:hypothetical protein